MVQCVSWLGGDDLVWVTRIVCEESRKVPFLVSLSNQETDYSRRRLPRALPPALPGRYRCPAMPETVEQFEEEAFGKALRRAPDAAAAGLRAPLQVDRRRRGRTDHALVAAAAGRTAAGRGRDRSVHRPGDLGQRARRRTEPAIQSGGGRRRLRARAGHRTGAARIAAIYLGALCADLPGALRPGLRDAD